MDGSICYKNEKHLPIRNLLEQYRKGLEQLLIAFNDARYVTCNRLIKDLEILMQQITQNQSVFAQHPRLKAEQFRIQELQSEFYERSSVQLNDLLKQMPKRTQLHRLEKFL